MLSRWFDKAKALEHQDADVRLKFLNGLTPDRLTELQDRLLDRLGREPAATVRAAILPLIRDVKRLTSLMQGSGSLHAEIADWIASHGAPDLDLCRAHPDIARARLLQTDSESERTALLGLFEGLEQRIELAIRARPELKAIILALPELAKEHAYTTIERLSRGRDKGVNRHARERMDAIRAIDDDLRGVRERASTITSAAAALMRQEPATAAARESRRRQLISLREENETLINREHSLIESATAAGAVRESSLSQLAFADIELEPPKESPYTQVLAAVPAINRWIDTSDFAGARAALETLQQEWQGLKALAEPTSEQIRRFAQVSEDYAGFIDAGARLDAMQWPTIALPGEQIPESDAREFWHSLNRSSRSIDTHARAERSLRWPETLVAPAKLLEQRELRERSAAAVARLVVAERSLAENIAAALKAAESVMDEGLSKQAHAQLAPLRREISRLTETMAQPLKQRLDTLYHRLGELRDWQTFATSPKREELLARMRELIGHVSDPEQLAQRIRRIRDDWNALGAPANRHEHGLRSEFEQVAAEAFEPCRAFFAEQDRIRQQHLETRQGLVSMLADYINSTDWTQADYHAAEKILQTARREWQQAFPLPRADRKGGDHKALIAEFEGLQQKLHDAIHAHYESASQRKQALIDRLTGMRESQPVDAQVEAAKQAQQDWKQIGAGLRHFEQKLWNEFRGVCDAIFADRAKAIETRNIERSALLTQAAELNRRFSETLAAWTPETANPAVLRDARAAFDELGDLGRDGRRLIDEHRALYQQGEAVLASQVQLRRKSRLDRIRELDASLTRGDTVEIDPKLRTYFASRQAIGANVSRKVEDLTLLAEITAGRESPPTEKTRRMALQVDLMNRRAERPDADSLLQDWCSIADKPADTGLHDRFFRAIADVDYR